MRFSFILSSLFVFIATQAWGIPLDIPMPMVQHEPNLLEPINVLVRRQGTDVQDAVEPPDGTIIPYKRNLENRQGTDVQDAVGPPDGTILPYKRELEVRQGGSTEVEDPVKSPDGVILPY